MLKLYPGVSLSSFSMCSIVSVDHWRVLPRLEPRSKCCQSPGHIQSGLMGEVRYWVDFTLVSVCGESLHYSLFVTRHKRLVT